MKSGNLNFWKPLGHSRHVMGLLYLYWVISARRPRLIKSSVAFLSPCNSNPLRRESQNDHNHLHPFWLTLLWKLHPHSTLQRAWITFIHRSITYTLTEWHCTVTYKDLLHKRGVQHFVGTKHVFRRQPVWHTVDRDVAYAPLTTST